MSTGAARRAWEFRELLSMEQIGREIGKSSEATRKWARRAAARGLALQKVGREWRIDRRDLNAFIASETRQALRAVQPRPVAVGQ